MKSKICIVGLGRIGRHLLRNFTGKSNFEIEVCDLNTDLHNICYLLNYDSVYGYREERFTVDGECLYCNATKTKIKFRTHKNIEAKVIIDSSGSLECLKEFRENEYYEKIYVTHAPDEFIDEYIIENVNGKSSGRVVSTSICDATAIAPIFKYIDSEYGIVGGHVTTLHPWLNYQNLSDSSVLSTDVPSSYWKDYSLGRKSTESLIPKTTSAIKALSKVLPDIGAKINSWSYRVPTPIVSTALLNLNLQKSVGDLESFGAEMEQVGGVVLAKRNMISSDFIELKANCAIDMSSVSLMNKSIFISVWYDNEYGYSSLISNYIERDL